MNESSRKQIATDNFKLTICALDVEIQQVLVRIIEIAHGNT